MKALYKLSLADAWIIATALREQAQLVHKDPEFEQVKERVHLLSLPYKHG
ncbi:MAG: PIN domain-containing protein [Candidatus Bipolaricaulota bacterium]|nr:PIN domain-containing protein [Candidatus Bipolaricaulota bacterium]